jgi:hypothetical protein
MSSARRQKTVALSRDAHLRDDETISKMWHPDLVVEKFGLHG